MKSYASLVKYLASVAFLQIISISATSQFLPIPIDQSSFNVDIVADGDGSDPVAVTTASIGTKIFYDATFRAANPIITSGGLPATGTIIDGTNVWQLNLYSTNNALYYPPQEGISQSSSQSLSLSEPGRYSIVSLLSAAIVSPVLVTIIVRFADGSTTEPVNYTVKEWGTGTPFVIGGVGLIERGPLANQTEPPGQPRLYQLDVPISEADQAKSIERIDIIDNDVSNAASVVFFAASGVVLERLPITFSSLSAQYKASENKIVLNWEAETSLNSSGFEVERSSDASVFSSIATITSKKGVGISYYSYIDYDLQNRHIWFYRIKETLPGGVINYSRIVNVKTSNTASLKIIQSPGYIYLATTLPDKSFKYKIVDLNGRELKSGTATSANHFSIDIHSLSSGYYIISIVNQTEAKAFKFVK